MPRLACLLRAIIGALRDPVEFATEPSTPTYSGNVAAAANAAGRPRPISRRGITSCHSVLAFVLTTRSELDATLRLTRAAMGHKAGPDVHAHSRGRTMPNAKHKTYFATRRDGASRARSLCGLTLLIRCLLSLVSFSYPLQKEKDKREFRKDV